MVNHESHVNEGSTTRPNKTRQHPTEDEDEHIDLKMDGINLPLSKKSRIVTADYTMHNASSTVARSIENEKEQQASQLQRYNAAFCSILVQYYCADTDVASADAKKSHLFQGVLTEFLKMTHQCALYRHVFRVLCRPESDCDSLKRILTVDLWERVNKYVEDLLRYRFQCMYLDPECGDSRIQKLAVPIMFTTTDLTLIHAHLRAQPLYQNSHSSHNVVPFDDMFAVWNLSKTSSTIERVSLRDLSISENCTSTALSVAMQKHMGDDSKATDFPAEDNIIDLDNVATMERATIDCLAFHPPSNIAFHDGVANNLSWQVFFVAKLPPSFQSRKKIHETDSEILIAPYEEIGSALEKHQFFDQSGAACVSSDSARRISAPARGLPTDRHVYPATSWAGSDCVLLRNAYGALKSDLDPVHLKLQKCTAPTKVRTRLPRGNPGTQYLSGEPLESDVKYGRGGGTNNHKGNIMYLLDKLKLQAGYTLLATQKGKKVISQELVDIVHKRGGRFVAREEDTGRWYIVDDTIARKKASQTLREDKTPEEQETKRNTLLIKIDEIAYDSKTQKWQPVAPPLSAQEQKASQTLLEFNALGREMNKGANWVPVEAENLLRLASTQSCTTEGASIKCATEDGHFM